MSSERRERAASDPREALRRGVTAEEARKLRARREKGRDLWFGLGMFGLVGWSVAVPTVAGVAIGLWLDRAAAAPFSWTLTMLVVGVAVGCLNAWYWVSRERRG